MPGHISSLGHTSARPHQRQAREHPGITRSQARKLPGQSTSQVDTKWTANQRSTTWVINHSWRHRSTVIGQQGNHVQHPPRLLLLRGANMYEHDRTSCCTVSIDRRATREPSACTVGTLHRRHTNKDL
ncbi:uncharacterized protein LOC114353607 [Ostrinia furnacalis]|uniref:uncharacterized protein LOC114353607 n=1 Tax=Ostrinia furnacalis TaxID=93504 RepID=UPI00103ED2D5|nr:uncharacterized protein LOC114353607 [Ostrinia furnacalis]